MPLSASHPLARHAPEHWPGIGWNAWPGFAGIRTRATNARKSRCYSRISSASLN